MPPVLLSFLQFYETKFDPVDDPFGAEAHSHILAAERCSSEALTSCTAPKFHKTGNPLLAHCRE